MTITVTINDLFYNLLKKYTPIDFIESAEILDILKVDLQKGYKIILVKIVMKKGHSIKEYEKSGSVEILSKISEDDRSITCLMKGKPPMSLFSKISNITNMFNVNVIWYIPSRMNGKKVVLSVIGDEKDLNRVAQGCKFLGSIENISFSKTFIQERDILHCLTEKQKDILIKAKQQGYYKYPRKVSSEFLSKKVGLSKATTIEHLRKAENRLIEQILSSY